MDEVTARIDAIVETALETLALLAIAGGTAVALYPVIGWSCLILGGLVLLGGLQVASGALGALMKRRRRGDR